MNKVIYVNTNLLLNNLLFRENDNTISKAILNNYK